VWNFAAPTSSRTHTEDGRMTLFRHRPRCKCDMNWSHNADFQQANGDAQHCGTPDHPAGLATSLPVVLRYWGSGNPKHVCQSNADCKEDDLRSIALTLAIVTLIVLGFTPPAAHADGICSFERGTTTCTSVAQATIAGTHTAFSGCLYGPVGLPGRRQRTFADTYLVTSTTTTLSHGRKGPVYDSKTTTTRQLTSSTLVSDTCQPLY